MSDHPVIDVSLDDESRFYALALRYLDGLTTAEEEEALCDHFRTVPEDRQRFVTICRQVGMLYETLSAESSEDDFGVGDSSTAPFPAVSVVPSYPQHSFGSVVLSYAVSAMILCVALLGAWGYKINHARDLAVDNNRRSTPPGQHELVVVGRITGVKDCRWENEGESTVLGASVSLNRKYALASGLLQITYGSGARVILEGPCTYKVDSDAGGFLAVGKLTARVEKKGSGFGVQGSEHSPLSPLPSPLFAVRTPTAIVTDLGTEFGVEVDENGDTTSCVFQGSISVQGLAASAASGDARNERVLYKNESIRVSRVRETHQDSGTTSQTTVRFTHPTQTPKFVRRLAAPPDTRAEESYIKAVLADKPLAYWPLNEPAGSRRFSDLSGNGFDGAAMGKVQAGCQGPLPGQSQAVELKGDGYVDVGRQDRFAMENGFTVEAWVFLDDCWQEGPLLHPRIISAGSSETRYQQSGWCVGFKALAVGELPLCCFGTYGYPTGSAAMRGAEMPLSHWVHVTLAFDSDNSAILYVNGERRMSLNVRRPAKIGPTWVTLGYGSDLGGVYWRGRLAHVAVYRSVLGEEQLAKHYRSSQNSADKSNPTSEGRKTTSGK